jgi:hypothetical protein
MELGVKIPNSATSHTCRVRVLKVFRQWISNCRIFNDRFILDMELGTKSYLLSKNERKNYLTLKAQLALHAYPSGMDELLYQARRDADSRRILFSS